jgi:hypothetical protein
MAMKVLFAVLILGGIFYFFVIKDDGRGSEVTPENVSYVVSAMGVCFKDGSTQCYKDVGSNFSRKFELPVILEIFEQNEDKQEIFARCHEVTHYLGRFEFLKTRSVPIAFQNASAVCHGGSYHGVIEGYFADKGIALDDIEALEVEVRNVCGQESDYEKKNIYSECVHGIGHAMMFITEGELTASLEFCDSLASRSEQTTCYGGVFMENSSSSTNLDHPSKYLKNDDPLYPCSILTEKYLDTCYSYQSSHFALISNHDWSKVIELCRSVPENYRNGCFRIIGSNQVGFSQDMATRKNNCELISEGRYKELCFEGIVDALVGRYNRDFDIIVSFCSILSEGDKENCYTRVGYALLGWVESPEDLQVKCHSVTEEKYIPACLKASGNVSGT